MRIEDVDITRCAQCNKLIQVAPGRELCNECAAEMAGAPLPEANISNPEKYALRFFSLPPELTQEPWHGPIADEQEPEETPEPLQHAASIPCERCKKRPPLGHSGLCVECHLYLHKTLGDASRDLFGKADFVLDRGLHKPSVSSAIERKRRRTATSHFNPVGARRLKW